MFNSITRRAKGMAVSGILWTATGAMLGLFLILTLGGVVGILFGYIIKCVLCQACTDG